MTDSNAKLAVFFARMAEVAEADKLGIAMGFHLGVALACRHPEYALALAPYLRAVSRAGKELSDDLIRWLPLAEVTA